MKFLNTSSEVKYIGLIALEEIAKKHQSILNPYYKRFYLLHLEKLYEIKFKYNDKPLLDIVAY